MPPATPLPPSRLVGPVMPRNVSGTSPAALFTERNPNPETKFPRTHDPE